MGMVVEAAEDGGDVDSAEDEGAEDGVTMQRYVLKVSNVSNRVITAFRGLVTYEDAEGQPVEAEGATPDVRYSADLKGGIAVGGSEELEVPLVAPAGTTAKIRLVEILYGEGNLGGIWMPAEKRE